MKRQTFFFVIIIVLILVAVLTIAFNSTGKDNSTKYDAFATCLRDKGAIFYGAFWCPHCQAEKKLFGSSVKLLPYIECSTPDGQDQTQICKDKKIESYPTWIFVDGSVLNGEISLQTLSDKTSCALPQ